MIRGHSRIPDSEKADELAKNGSKESGLGAEPVIGPYSRLHTTKISSSPMCRDCELESVTAKCFECTCPDLKKIRARVKCEVKCQVEA